MKKIVLIAIITLFPFVLFSQNKETMDKEKAQMIIDMMLVKVDAVSQSMDLVQNVISYRKSSMDKLVGIKQDTINVGGKIFYTRSANLTSGAEAIYVIDSIVCSVLVKEINLLTMVLKDFDSDIFISALNYVDPESQKQVVAVAVLKKGLIHAKNSYEILLKDIKLERINLGISLGKG